MRADEYQHRPARAQPPPGLSVSSPGIYRVPEYAHEYGCPIRDRVALRRINRSSLPGWIRVGWIYLVRSKVSLGNLFLLQIHRPNLCCSNRCQELYCTLYDSWKNGWDEVRLLPELYSSLLLIIYIYILRERPSKSSDSPLPPSAWQIKPLRLARVISRG